MSSKLSKFIGIMVSIAIMIVVIKVLPTIVGNQSSENTTTTTTTPTTNSNSSKENSPNYCQDNKNRTSTTFGQTYAQFTEVPTGITGTFKYGGSTTLAPIRGLVDPEITKAIPSFKLQYINPKPEQGKAGSSTGIKMLLAEDIDFGHSSRQLKEEEKEQGLKQIPVAIDGLVFAVNPRLNIEGLTVDEIKDIYTGKIRNWQEVGGPNLKITAYTRDKEAGGTVEFFIEEFLEQKKDTVQFGNNTVLAVNTTDGLRKVAEDMGGIYYASAPEVVDQCTVKSIPIGVTKDDLIAPYQAPFITKENCNNNNRNKINFQVFKNCQYPKTRELYVIVKENGGREQQIGEYYGNLLLTDQGQKLIEKANFLKIR